MTKVELKKILEILNKIKDPDVHVAQAISYVNKDIAGYDARKGQLREYYEIERN